MPKIRTSILEDVPQVDPNYVFLTAYYRKPPGGLFRNFFDVRPGLRAWFQSDHEAIAEAIEAALSTLTPHEKKLQRTRLRLNARRQKNYTLQDVADDSWSRLRVRLLRFLEQRSSPHRLAELVPVIERIKRLEPSLIAHLQQHNDDLVRINPVLFEHLFAEFLAARGFDDVRLVGRNARTSADIFAAKFIPGPEILIKLFVEVKRWKDTIGIEVINQVLGAFMSERERFGWNAALIVSVGGFKEFEKWSREELALKGLFLKDRGDLLQYLDGYRQHANGLWLPNPRTHL
jgi:hypothetical protein